MRDERAAVVRSRADRELRPRRSNVDQTDQVRGAAMRRKTTGRKRRRLKSDSIVQRGAGNEIDTAMQHDQPPAADAGADLMVSESGLEELLTCDEAGLWCCASREAPFQFGV